ncbi:MAG TPA: glycosyltransferase family 2 protein [Kineosporiaceae bacterium]|nr:glycosyltransferase family 2 protein [Kineosporiaceae bacterium]
MTSPPRSVAVVVVTYNSAPLIPDLLKSLPAGLDGLDWRLVVADNDSADATVAVVRDLAPSASVVQLGRNAGYAAGINAGVARAGEFDAVLVLNPDVRLEPGCVAELVRALDLPGTGMAVPRLSDGDGTLILSRRREPSVPRAWADALLGAERVGGRAWLGEVVTDPGEYTREAVTDWAEGSTLLIGRTGWDRCGPWDEGFFLYSEETDFALRLRDAGLVTRFVPSARAVHLEGDSGQSPGLWTLLMLNRVRLFAKRHGPLPTALYWSALVVREALRAALGKVTSRAALPALLSPRRLREPRGPGSVVLR